MQYHFQKYRLEIVREETLEREYSVCLKKSEDVHRYLVDVCRLHKNHLLSSSTFLRSICAKRLSFDL